jgi:hypothetical protein
MSDLKNKIALQRKTLQGDYLNLWRAGRDVPRTFEPFVRALLSG